jgi:hypothetical protein
LGEDKLGSREARKESRSLGIFKGVSKTSESSTTPPPQISTPEDLIHPIPTIAEPGKPEKTTKTTATYYPKLSRQESIASRKESVIRESAITTTSEEPTPSTTKREPIIPAALASLGYESESGDEFGSGSEWKSPKVVALKPYSHQVGGHSALFRFSRHAVCKPLIEKENAFYQDIEIHRPECTSPLLFDYCFFRGVDFSTPFYAEIYWNFKCYS